MILLVYFRNEVGRWLGWYLVLIFFVKRRCMIFLNVEDFLVEFKCDRSNVWFYVCLSIYKLKWIVELY